MQRKEKSHQKVALYKRTAIGNYLPPHSTPDNPLYAAWNHNWQQFCQGKLPLPKRFDGVIPQLTRLMNALGPFVLHGSFMRYLLDPKTQPLPKDIDVFIPVRNRGAFFAMAKCLVEDFSAEKTFYSVQENSCNATYKLGGLELNLSYGRDVGVADFFSVKTCDYAHGSLQLALFPQSDPSMSGDVPFEAALSAVNGDMDMALDAINFRLAYPYQTASQLHPKRVIKSLLLPDYIQLDPKTNFDAYEGYIRNLACLEPFYKEGLRKPVENFAKVNGAYRTYQDAVSHHLWRLVDKVLRDEGQSPPQDMGNVPVVQGLQEVLYLMLRLREANPDFLLDQGLTSLADKLTRSTGMLSKACCGEVLKYKDKLLELASLDDEVVVSTLLPGFYVSKDIWYGHQLSNLDALVSAQKEQGLSPRLMAFKSMCQSKTKERFSAASKLYAFQQTKNEKDKLYCAAKALMGDFPFTALEKSHPLLFPKETTAAKRKKKKKAQSNAFLQKLSRINGHLESSTLGWQRAFATVSKKGNASLDTVLLAIKDKLKEQSADSLFAMLDLLSQVPEIYNNMDALIKDKKMTGNGQSPMGKALQTFNRYRVLFSETERRRLVRSLKTELEHRIQALGPKNSNTTVELKNLSMDDFVSAYRDFVRSGNDFLQKFSSGFERHGIDVHDLGKTYFSQQEAYERLITSSVTHCFATATVPDKIDRVGLLIEKFDSGDLGFHHCDALDATFCLDDPRDALAVFVVKQVVAAVNKAVVEVENTEAYEALDHLLDSLTVNPEDHECSRLFLKTLLWAKINGPAGLLAKIDAKLKDEKNGWSDLLTDDEAALNRLLSPEIANQIVPRSGRLVIQFESIARFKKAVAPEHRSWMVGQLSMAIPVDTLLALSADHPKGIQLKLAPLMTAVSDYQQVFEQADPKLPLVSSFPDLPYPLNVQFLLFLMTTHSENRCFDDAEVRFRCDLIARYVTTHTRFEKELLALLPIVKVTVPLKHLKGLEGNWLNAAKKVKASRMGAFYFKGIAENVLGRFSDMICSKNSVSQLPATVLSMVEEGHDVLLELLDIVANLFPNCEDDVSQRMETPLGRIGWFQSMLRLKTVCWASLDRASIDPKTEKEDLPLFPDDRTFFDFALGLLRPETYGAFSGLYKAMILFHLARSVHQIDFSVKQDGAWSTIWELLVESNPSQCFESKKMAGAYAVWAQIKVVFESKQFQNSPMMFDSGNAFQKRAFACYPGVGSIVMDLMQEFNPPRLLVLESQSPDFYLEGLCNAAVALFIEFNESLNQGEAGEARLKQALWAFNRFYEGDPLCRSLIEKKLGELLELARFSAGNNLLKLLEEHPIVSRILPESIRKERESVEAIVAKIEALNQDDAPSLDALLRLLSTYRQHATEESLSSNDEHTLALKLCAAIKGALVKIIERSEEISKKSYCQFSNLTVFLSYVLHKNCNPFIHHIILSAAVLMPKSPEIDQYLRDSAKSQSEVPQPDLSIFPDYIQAAFSQWELPDLRKKIERERQGPEVGLHSVFGLNAHQEGSIRFGEASDTLANVQLFDNPN